MLCLLEIFLVQAHRALFDPEFELRGYTQVLVVSCVRSNGYTRVNPIVYDLNVN